MKDPLPQVQELVENNTREELQEKLNELEVRWEEMMHKCGFNLVRLDPADFREWQKVEDNLALVEAALEMFDSLTGGSES